MFAGAKQRLEREHNQRAWAVWHVAALSRAKSMPDLSKLLVRNRSRAGQQTWQEQYQIMQMWAAQQQQARRLLAKEDEAANGR